MESIASQTTEKPTIAQAFKLHKAGEIEKVIPEVVSTDENGMKSVAYGNITGILIEPIKELKQEIETLKAQINN